MDEKEIAIAITQSICPECNSKKCNLLLITTTKENCKLDCQCNTCGLLYRFNLGYDSVVEIIKQEDKKAD